ncbi:MAG: sigma-70 family RNA polymerase sigma factor [Gemmatimonadetes bacterium]|nr:sigma-70 family RNA polymerase sigma factor [Gemmatimonadota bacterium]
MRARDPEALGRFFDRYIDAIHGLAARMLGNPTAAEDVTQEVFLKVHRALDRLDSSRDPWPWLTAITCNACREVWRGRHHKAGERTVPLADLADWEKNHPVSGDSPERDLLGAERAAAVQRAITELPDTLREVVLLHDWKGLSHQEIAEALGATYPAIRKRYSRALQALGDILGEAP